MDDIWPHPLYHFPQLVGHLDRSKPGEIIGFSGYEPRQCETVSRSLKRRRGKAHPVDRCTESREGPDAILGGDVSGASDRLIERQKVHFTFSRNLAKQIVVPLKSSSLGRIGKIMSEP